MTYHFLTVYLSSLSVVVMEINVKKSVNFTDHFSSRFFQNAIKSSISMEKVVVPKTAVNLIGVSRLNNMEGLNSVTCLSNS